MGEKMTSERWKQIFDEEIERAIRNFGAVEIPSQWEYHKTMLTNFIGVIDKATEVYYIENPREIK
jgi:hypothetical protein